MLLLVHADTRIRLFLKFSNMRHKTIHCVRILPAPAALVVVLRSLLRWPRSDPGRRHLHRSFPAKCPIQQKVAITHADMSFVVHNLVPSRCELLVQVGVEIVDFYGVHPGPLLAM